MAMQLTASEAITFLRRLPNPNERVSFFIGDLRLRKGATGPAGEGGEGGTYTVSRAIVSDGDGALSAATTTATEIGYVNGVTSAIQTQLNAKATTSTKLDDFATPDDNTDLNASNARHGLLRKLDDDTTHFLRGDGAWAIPAGGGGGATWTFSSVDPDNGDGSNGDFHVNTVTDDLFQKVSGSWESKWTPFLTGGYQNTLQDLDRFYIKHYVSEGVFEQQETELDELGDFFKVGTAVHLDVPNEIQTLSPKTSLDGADKFLIEGSEEAGAKMYTEMTYIAEYIMEEVIGQSAFVADPTGGIVQDDESRTVIGSILDCLIARGLMAAS